MGGSASYRLAKKIANARLNGAPQTEIDDLERKRQAAKEAEREKRRQQNSENQSPYRESYDQKRLDNAIWTNDKQEVDDKFRESSGKAWNSFDDQEKIAAMNFTGGYYRKMNRFLGGDLKPTDYGYDDVVDYVQNLTSALDKSEIPEDIWVRRGVSDRHLNRLFGFNLNTPTNDMLNGIQEAINNNKIVDVNNFMSTGATSDTGFTGTEMKIFVPKGSKGIYAEPFSSNGMGDGIDWDGISGQSGFGSEFEILLQRGYKLKPIAINRKGGMFGDDQIVFVIVGQESKPVQRQEIDWNNI